jgi:hypothetical protein
VRLEERVSWFLHTLKISSPTNKRENSEKIRKEVCQRGKTGRSAHEHTGIPESDRRRTTGDRGSFTA